MLFVSLINEISRERCITVFDEDTKKAIKMVQNHLIKPFTQKHTQHTHIHQQINELMPYNEYDSI